MNRVFKIIAALVYCAIASTASAQTGGTFWRIDRSGGLPYFLQFNVDAAWKTIGSIDSTNAFHIGSIGAYGVVSVTDYPGVDPTGTTDSTTGILLAISTGNRKVVFPCGTFLVSSVLALPSNTELAGSGPCTTIKASASMAFNPQYANWYGGTTTTGRNIFANANFAGTDHDIYVHDFNADATLWSSADVFHIGTFSSANHVVVERIRFFGGGSISSSNALSFIGQSYQYTVKDNYAQGTSNACFDQWDGVHDFLLEGNFCEGDGYVLNGIQVNGLVSGLPAGSPAIGRISYDFRIIGNSVRDTASSPISIRGLCLGATCGEVRNGEIVGNIVNGVSPAGALVPGIFVGDGSDIGVGFNEVSNMRGPCAIAAGQIAASVTRNITISNNTCFNINTLGAGGTTDNAIYVGTSADAPDGVSVVGNTVRNGNYSYAIRVLSGTNVKVIPGNMTAGSSGTILAGTGVNIVGSAADNHVGAGTANTTWRDTTGGNILTCGVNAGFPLCNGTGSITFQATNTNALQITPTAVSALKKLGTLASATGAAGFNMPHGAAPTSPVNGDFWTTTVSPFIQINGATKTLAALETAQTWTAQQTFNGGVIISGGTVQITASYLVSPAIYGGGTASSALNLLSTYGAGTTDTIAFFTGSQVLRWQIPNAGHLLAGTDNAYDIGATGATRPRNVFVAGNITIGDATALIKSSVAMNDGAGAGAGTITNAPAAGNPTKWIPINDNGTTRYVPAW